MALQRHDVYDEDITVEWVGNVPRTFNQQSFLSSSLQTVIIWSSGTDSMNEAGAPSRPRTKRFFFQPFPTAAVATQKPRRVQFRRVTTEKRKDFH